MSILRVEGLEIGYERQILCPTISFSVDEGDYLCIVGENGAGKSTLMKTILGLIQPLGGSFEFEGPQGRKSVGYLPQQTAMQRDFPASVLEVVLSGMLTSSMGPFYSRKDKLAARENLEKMGIASLEKRSYRELSGGQQQRVLLARALCAGSSLLFLDEPVSGLDPKAAADMYSLIEGLNKQGLAVIMISHDLAPALRSATHILHIGSRVFFGTKDEYVKSDIGKVFLREETEP